MKNILKIIPWGTILRIIGLLCVALLLLSMAWVAYFSVFDVTKTPQMAFYKFDAKGDSLNFKVEHQWVPIDSISRNMIVAILAAQDKDFYIHDGFSLISGEDSIISRIPNHHETISQRTAHTVFLTKDDSWVKNILEPYFTTLEEYLWGKDRILEIYLNTVLTGDGIFGVEAASQIYFGKGAGNLTLNEAAFIASTLENPVYIDINNPSEEILTKQKEILLRMGFIMHIKLGKTPIDEKEPRPLKTINKRNWKG
ncbi:hypothetical protein D0T53_00940 [Dysgonomonas sp. 216]|uniref:transglycosylase domain-containing protein n=1 Tax=Dysgonomonas sp. 216 TaxID=2302934 RepID=UPI0013D80952|nr:transglycosylase domain-containing protein [Dysgonomonas sp. 216]NDW17478.1 hypothetical protein [Dysgonomonas sp. 216]